MCQRRIIVPLLEAGLLSEIPVEAGPDHPMPPRPLPPQSRPKLPSPPGDAESFSIDEGHEDSLPHNGSPHPTRREIDDEQEDPPSLWRDPVKLAVAVSGFGAIWLLIFVVLSIVIWRSRSETLPLLIVLLLLSVIPMMLSAYFAFQLIMAKNRAIAAYPQPVTLFFGQARLVTWEQNEGLIFMKDKRITEQVYGPRCGGGLRIIYTILGEELRGRIPLALQLTWFEDNRVPTREAIRLTVKVAISWRVANLETYFYKIDHREVHAIKDRGVPGEMVIARASPTARGQLAMAEIWIQTLVESCLRRLISETSTFLIVSKNAASCLHIEGTGKDPIVGGNAGPMTPDVLGNILTSEVRLHVEQYGLSIDHIQVQEVQLPGEIQQAVDDVWVASTQPARSKYEAEALRQRLQVLCDTIGPQAAGMAEIVKAMPEGSLLGNPLAGLQALLAPLAGPGPSPALPLPPIPLSPGPAPPLPAPRSPAPFPPKSE